MKVAFPASVPSAGEARAIVAALELAARLRGEPQAPERAPGWRFAARHPELGYDELRAALR